MTDTCKIRFTATIGVAKRGQFKRAMRAYCWDGGYELNIEEDKGWLESVLHFQVTVPADQGRKVQAELNDWIARLGRAE